jgi:hypothetical protein
MSINNVLYMDQYFKKKIKAIRDRTRQNVLEIGRQLTEVRGALNHEEFVSWLEVEFGWPERIAQRYMQAYEKYGLDAEKFPLETLFSVEDWPTVLSVIDENGSM